MRIISVIAFFIGLLLAIHGIGVFHGRFEPIIIDFGYQFAVTVVLWAASFLFWTTENP